jgi:hypothetical protein
VAGVAAEQARAAHDGLVARTGRMIAEVEPARAAFAAAAGQVAALRAELRRVEDFAAAAGYAIDDHGGVADLGGADVGAVGDDRRTPLGGRVRGPGGGLGGGRRAGAGGAGSGGADRYRVGGRGVTGSRVGAASADQHGLDQPGHRTGLRPLAPAWSPVGGAAAAVCRAGRGEPDREH